MRRSTPACLVHEGLPRKGSPMDINRGLCAHCEMVANRCNFDPSITHALVSKLSNMDSGTLKETCSEITSLMSSALTGDLKNLDPSEYHCLGFRTNRERVTVRGVRRNRATPAYVPRDKFLYELITLDGHSSVAQFAWASMMKLKTCIPARLTSQRIARSELNDHYHSIVDGFSGTMSVVRELQRYIPSIVEGLIYLSNLREGQTDEVYKPLALSPASDRARTVTIQRDGKPLHCTAKLSELEAFNILIQMGSRSIREIYRADPDRFVSRVFTGTKVQNASFDIDSYAISEEMDVPLGTVRFLPKPGGKERVVTVPAEIMQALSYGIGQTLKKINSSWSVQGVDSHETCVNFVSSKIRDLQSSRVIFDSADQSNYTDRLPYDLVSRMILLELEKRHILAPVDILICDVVCHSPVIIPDMGNLITRYGVGTPMGTYPSFPLGSLTNGVVYCAAYMIAHDIPPDSRVTPKLLQNLPARVIGDDIFSWLHKAFREYTRLMNGVGCSIQPSKCLSSNYVGEMCSKIITSNGVYEQKKIDSLLSAHDLPGFAHNYDYYGEPYLKYVSDECAEQLQLLKAIPRPYGLAPHVDDPYWDRFPEMRKCFKAFSIGQTYDRGVTLNAYDYAVIARRLDLILPKDLTFEIVDLDQTDFDRTNILVDSLVRDMIDLTNEVKRQDDIDVISNLVDMMTVIHNEINSLEDRLHRADPRYRRYVDRSMDNHLKSEMNGTSRNYGGYRKVLPSIPPGLSALSKNIRKEDDGNVR